MAFDKPVRGIAALILLPLRVTSLCLLQGDCGPHVSHNHLAGHETAATEHTHAPDQRYLSNHQPNVRTIVDDALIQNLHHVIINFTVINNRNQLVEPYWP